jgi:hypothetical protein
LTFDKKSVPQRCLGGDWFAGCIPRTKFKHLEGGRGNCPAQPYDIEFDPHECVSRRLKTQWGLFYHTRRSQTQRLHCDNSADGGLKPQRNGFEERS